MKIYLLVPCLFGLVLWMGGCAHATIVPFKPATTDAKTVKYPPNPPENVGIYRSTHPFLDFLELGLITFRTESRDLNAIYNQLRKDAGAQGADAVVDVKSHSETHTESTWQNECVPQTECSPDGSCNTVNQCTPQMVTQTVTNLVIEGTMIKKKY